MPVCIQFNSLCTDCCTDHCKGCLELTDTRPPITTQHEPTVTLASEGANCVGAALITPSIPSGALVNICTQNTQSCLVVSELNWKDVTQTCPAVCRIQSETITTRACEGGAILGTELFTENIRTNTLIDGCRGQRWLVCKHCIKK